MMKIAKKKTGLLIGAIFTGASLLMTGTYIVPIISVLPGILFENISENLVNNDPYSNVGRTTIVLLFILFLMALSFSLLWIKHETAKKGQISVGQVVTIMLLLYFIVHPLGFYIYWSVALNFKSDGQLMLGATRSYPVSGLAFIFIGLAIDLAKKIFEKT